MKNREETPQPNSRKIRKKKKISPLLLVQKKSQELQPTPVINLNATLITLKLRKPSHHGVLHLP